MSGTLLAYILYLWYEYSLLTKRFEMKKSLVITALAVAVLTVVPSCTGKDNLVTNPILTNVILENLPKEAKGFIDQHFGTYEMRTLRKASHVQDNGTF